MQTSEWATQICESFPKSPSGLTRYRVRWAPDCEEVCYGKTRKAYPHIGEFWILEVLVPWAKFGLWHEDAFGPKPIDGAFGHCHTIRYRDGEQWVFMSLEDFGAESLRLLIQCVEASRIIQGWQMRNHRDAMLEAAEKEEHRIFTDIYDDATGIGLVGGPLGENAVSGIPGKKTSADQEITVVNELSPELVKKYACRPGSVKQIS